MRKVKQRGRSAVVAVAMIGAVALVPAPAPASAGPSEAFAALGLELQNAHQAYMMAMMRAQEKGDAAAVPDGRTAVLRRMDALVEANWADPAGPYVATETLLMSAYLGIDPAGLADRFDKTAKHYPNASDLLQSIFELEMAAAGSDTPGQWVEALDRLASATTRKEMRVASLELKGIVQMSSGQHKKAKATFAGVAKLDPKGLIGKEAGGFIREIDHLQVGMTAPDFTTKTLDGKSVSLKDFRGKVVLLNFWATW